MIKLGLDFLRILNENYKSKTEKVSKLLLEAVKENHENESTNYISNFMEFQILALADKIREEKNDSDNTNRIITLP